MLIAVKVQDKLQKYVVPFYAVCDGAGCPVDIRLAQTRELARRLKMNTSCFLYINNLDVKKIVVYYNQSKK